MSQAIRDSETEESISNTNAYYEEGYISEERYALSIYSSSTLEEVTSFDYYKDDNGLVELRQLNPFTNEIVTQTTDIEFSSYKNPWLLVDEATGSLDENQATFTLDETSGIYLWQVLTGTSYTATEAVVSLASSGDIDEITLTTGWFTNSSYEVSLTFTYSLCELSDVSLEAVTTKERTSDHDTLGEVFDELNKGNYTLDYSYTWSACDNDTGDYSSDMSGSSRLKAYFTEEAILIEDTSLHGVINYDDGYQLFDVESEGNFVGTSLTTPGYTVSDFVAPFTILPEMFSYEGNGVYIYDVPGTEELLTYNMPEATFAETYNIPDTGTYKWTLLDDGDVEITYTHTEVSFWYTYTYEFAVKVSNIGSTSLGEYTFTPYVVTQSGWEDVENAIYYLNLHGIEADELPWINLGGEWIAYGYSYGSFAMDYLYSSTSLTLEEATSRVNEALLGAGWQTNNEIETTYYGTLYWYERKNGDILYISVDFSGLDYGGLYIYLMDPELAVRNDLEAWMRNNFEDGTSLNYTLNANYYSVNYDIFEENGQYYYDSGSAEYTTLLSPIKYFDNDAYQTGDYIYIETSSGIDMYQYSSEDGAYSLARQYTNTAWNSYTIANSFYTLNDIVTSQFDLYDEAYDGYYTCSNDVANALISIAGFSVSGTVDFSGIIIYFGSESGELLINLYYGGSADYDNLTYTEYLLEISITDVGTTTIDRFFLENLA